MTKEMCPTHWVDVLAHALLYYGLGIKNKLRKKLLFGWAIVFNCNEILFGGNNCNVIVFEWFELFKKGTNWPLLQKGSSCVTFLVSKNESSIGMTSYAHYIADGTLQYVILACSFFRGSHTWFATAEEFEKVLTLLPRTCLVT